MWKVKTCVAFVGGKLAQMNLKKKSWKSKEAFYGIKSNCPYFVKMKKIR